MCGGAMGLSMSHLLLVLVVVFILFGAGKLPVVMRDLARGLKAFKKELGDDAPDPDDVPPSNLL